MEAFFSGIKALLAGINPLLLQEMDKQNEIDESGLKHWRPETEGDLEMVKEELRALGLPVN